MFALDPDVAGQSAQPFWHEPTPHRQPDKRHNDANDHDESSQVAHDSKSCAIQTEAQA
jgi:hypothetical protein